MARKSWQLARRSFLMGTGVSLALPFLECMAHGAAPTPAPAKRLCAMYFGFGVSLPKPGSEQSAWSWFPEGEGRDFRFNRSLEPLARHRQDISVLGGLSHPMGRKMGGHDTGDTFLTAALMNTGLLRNSVSLDQLAAAQLGDQTRFRSLVLSTDGGVGEPTRATTLSFDERGDPVPALNQPQQIFDRFFGAGDAKLDEDRRRLASSQKMLDRVLDHSRSLRADLGVQDRRKLDEYLSSVRQVETQVERSQAWLEIPRPALNDEDRSRLDLESDDTAPLAFMRTMYELIALAFRTDSTRVATYQISNMNGAASKAGKFPQIEGFKGTLHNLAHGWNKPEGAEKLGQWDRFMAEQFAVFLDRLAEAEDEHGRILDNTVVLYGSSNSQTHNNTNYPLVVAGGGQLGMRHGQYLRYKDDVPMSNLLLTLLRRVGVSADSFADSTGELAELI